MSTGDLLREEARSGKLLSDEDQRAIDEGHLVSDDVVRDLLEERLRRKDTKRGFVIDGYPRNIPQAQSLDNLLGMMGRPLQIAIYTEMADDLLTKRNVGRQTCTVCGAIYNKFFSPPAKTDICDLCGGALGVRKDDTPKAVAARVAVYREKTTPLITYFRAQHKLRTVAAAGSVEEIHEKISAIVDLEIRPLEIEAVFSATDNGDEAEQTVIAGGQINRIVQPAPSLAGNSHGKPAEVAAAGDKAAGDKPATEKTTQKSAANKSAKKVAASKPAARSLAKKATAKKPVAKKAAKKATTKKPVAKKAAKKTTAKKPVAKKPAKKATAKKPVAKKAAKKATTKKPVAKKAAKKATAKKPVAKKAAKKAIAKKPVAKKAAKKAIAKKPVAKKAAKKATAKKPAKKATARQSTAKKSSKKTGKN